MSFVEEREDSVCQPHQQEQQPQRDPRYYIANELLQTEQNYVNILSVIVKVGLNCRSHMLLHKRHLKFATIVETKFLMV